MNHWGSDESLQNGREMIQTGESGKDSWNNLHLS